VFAGGRGWSVFRRSLAFLLLLLAASGAVLSGCGEEGLFPAVVTEVVDGDTVYVKLNGREEKVRLIGVDTPETKHPEIGKEPFGEEASLYTKQKLLGRRVYLSSKETATEGFLLTSGCRRLSHFLKEKLGRRCSMPTCF